MTECAAVLFAACMLDLVAGDPVYPLHPVRLVGKLIVALEAPIRRAGFCGIAGGVLLEAAVLTVTLGCYLGVRVLLSALNGALCPVWDVFVAYSCLSMKDLVVHAKKVSGALRKDDLAGARFAVQKMVGRDANLLDACGVVRAAVESVAENFVDGFLSPLFWYGAGCAACAVSACSSPACAVGAMLAYKVVNTLDSMVGYKDSTYLYFGRAPAMLDDAVNCIPARLSIPVMGVASSLCGLNALGCLKTGLRDRLKHTSPNAGHAESCAAGALGIRLGGPTRYAFGVVEKPWLGDGGRDITAGCIDECCRLVLCSGLVSAGVAVLVLVLAG